MNMKNKLVAFIRVLISDPDIRFHVIIIAILISLILGSSILADILLEQLLQADGITRLSSLQEVI